MGRGFVTAESVQGLEEIKSLHMGSTEAPDKNKRKRVTEEEFKKVLSHLGSVVADMLKIIWLTGMRPYEVCSMRPYDIICEDPDCWLYIPGRDKSPVGKHKTARFERVKVIPLTQQCQEILKPRINKCNIKEYIFSPKETMREFYEEKLASRKTPLSCGNRPGSNLKENPMIKPGVKYGQDALRRACKRACKKAGVIEFTPYDLRRTTATRVRSAFGKEATKVLLGHTKTDTTELYLLEEVQEAMKVAKMLSSKS
jgi:integrase